MRRLISFLFLLCALTASAVAQSAYPTKPIILVLGFAPGGISDGLVRQIAEFARESRGATVVIDYKPGAASTIAAALIKRAAPDGYTVHLMSPSAMQVIPNLQSLPYDPDKDFTYVSMVLAQPQPLYVLDTSRFQAFADVLAYARANPGKFSWGTAGNNSLAQIVLQSAFAKEGVQTTVVGFKGGSEAITALIGGHIDAVASTDFGPLYGSKKVRLIVETGEQKAAANVPTLKELGYPLHSTLKYGIVGPKGMSAEAVKWWNSLIQDFSRSSKAADFASKYYGALVHSTPEQTTAEVVNGHAQIGRAVKALGIKAE